jgi:hypothetical protein
LMAGDSIAGDLIAEELGLASTVGAKPERTMIAVATAVAAPMVAMILNTTIPHRLGIPVARETRMVNANSSTVRGDASAIT